MSSIIYEASLQLDWIVVGGGIAGLATAFVLRRAGHRVRVLERQDTLGCYPAGLRIPPNLSKILREWVGEEELLRTAVRNVGTPWYDMESGERVGYHHWTPAVMKETGGDFLMMHHNDVIKMLFRLASDAGVEFQFGVEVLSVEGTDAAPIVRLADGQELRPDMVVGADGPTSIVRQTAFGLDDNAVAEATDLTVLGGIIPADKMMEDPELGEFVKADEWPIFMGPNRSMCCHPVIQRGKKEFAIQIYWPTDEAGPDNDGLESWYETIPTSTLDISPYAPNFQRLVQMTPTLTRTRFVKRSEEPEDWSDDSGRIVLVGEAAHPWLPGGSHTASMVVEDAVVLGTLFSHLDKWSQVGSFLNAYQELREGRTKAVKVEETTNADLVALPHGEKRDARNKNMAPARRDSEWDEGVLKRELDVFAEIFCYQAYDAAAEWWIDWGRFSSRDESEEAPDQTTNWMFGAVTAVTGEQHSDDGLQYD